MQRRLCVFVCVLMVSVSVCVYVHMCAYLYKFVSLKLSFRIARFI